MALGRLVLDTNVLLSALHFHAVSLSWLRAAWREERLRPLVSRRTAAELIRVLAYPKFRLSEDDQKHLLDDYLPWCETVVVPDPPPDVPRCRDPSDHPFLELAVAGQADALVTGDGDLLVLAAEFFRSDPCPGRGQGPLVRSGGRSVDGGRAGSPILASVHRIVDTAAQRLAALRKTGEADTFEKMSVWIEDAVTAAQAAA